MPNDVTVDSSTTPPTDTDPADLFYKDTPQDVTKVTTPEADSTTATPSETKVETEPASEPGTEPEEPLAERGPDGKFRRSDASTRIKQLLGENKRLAEQLAAKAEPPKAEAKAAEPEAKPQAEAPPEPGQFQTWDEYRKADALFVQKQIDAKVREAIEKDRLEQTAKAKEQTEKQTLEIAQKSWMGQITASVKKHPDFNAKVFDESGSLRLELHPVFDTFIPKSKVGSEILYYLATHLDEAEAIAKLEPLEATGEFHRLQSELSAQQAPLLPKPKPPSTVSGNARPGRELSDEERFYGANP